MQTVKDLMNAKVKSVYMNDRLSDAQDLMSEENLKLLPVINDENRYVGVLSEKDIIVLKRTYEHFENILVWEVCKAPIPLMSVDKDTKVIEAATLMVNESFHHLFVIEKDKIAGVLSALDIVTGYIHDSVCTCKSCCMNKTKG
jgi:CBS domain-containing protein